MEGGGEGGKRRRMSWGDSIIGGYTIGKEEMLIIKIYLIVCCRIDGFTIRIVYETTQSIIRYYPT